MNGAGFWADLLEGPVDATVEERHAAMDRLDPHGRERRRQDRERLARLQRQQRAEVYGTPAYHALSVAISVHIGARRTLLIDLEQLDAALEKHGGAG